MENNNKSSYTIKTQKLNINQNNKDVKHTESKLKLKKINVDLPIKYKSLDYFKMLDGVRSSLKSSGNELGRNNICICLVTYNKLYY